MRIIFNSIGDRPFTHLMINSVRANMPDCELMQVSDEKTPIHKGVNAVIRYPYNGKNAFFKLETRMAFDFDYIALDDDMIITKPLNHLMEGDFDIALCTRQTNGDGANDLLREKCPYNSGMIVSKNYRFWEECYKVLPTLKPHWQEWFGEQIAIAEVAKSGKFKVKELSGDLYNRTPKKNEKVNEDSYVWHFKGDRKSWMTGLESAKTL